MYIHHTCIHIDICTCIQHYICIYVCICMYDVYIYTSYMHTMYMNIYMHTICIYVHVHIDICTCIQHVHIYAYSVHVYIHIYSYRVHAYTYANSVGGGLRYTYACVCAHAYYTSPSHPHYTHSSIMRVHTALCDVCGRDMVVSCHGCHVCVYFLRVFLLWCVCV